MKISEFVDRLANGEMDDSRHHRSFCEIEGVPVGVITVPKGGSAGRPLVAVFHGSVKRSIRKIPTFSGGNLQRQLEGKATIISVADPALGLAPDLQAAWYTGWSQCDVPAVLREFFCALQPSASRLVFAGGSVGAHPAMYHSALLPGSVCIAYNPIACVSRYFEKHVRKMRRVCWPDLRPESPLSDVIQDDVGDMYKAGHRNSLIYLQNTTDHHFVLQAIPFLSRKKPSENFLFCSEFFNAHQGHTYPRRRFANWVRASVKSKSTHVLAIAEIAEKLNANASEGKRAGRQSWTRDDVVVARQIAQAYAS